MTVAIHLSVEGLDGGGSDGALSLLVSFLEDSDGGSMTSCSSLKPSTSSVTAILPMACTGRVVYAGAFRPHLEYAYG